MVNEIFSFMWTKAVPFEVPMFEVDFHNASSYNAVFRLKFVFKLQTSMKYLNNTVFRNNRSRCSEFITRLEVMKFEAFKPKKNYYEGHSNKRY